MKRIFCVLCVLCLILPCLFACAEEGTETKKRYDYDLSEYVTIPDPRAIQAEYDDPSVCTPEEIDEAIFQIMLSNAGFTGKEGGVVEKYNKVELSFVVELDGEVQDAYSQENHSIIVGYEGNGDLDYVLGEALIGKAVGETASADYTYPPSALELGSFAGKTVTVKGTISKIYSHSIPEFTELFVQQMNMEGIETIEDFRVYLDMEILASKRSAMEAAVLDAYLAGVTVKKYPEAELQDYKNRYIENVKSIANQFGMTVDEYMKLYMGSTEGELESLALSDAQTRVKNDLACIQGSRVMGTTLTEEEYQEGLTGYFETNGAGEFESEEEFEAYYTREILYESILWDKTFQVMVENATPIENS